MPPATTTSLPQPQRGKCTTHTNGDWRAGGTGEPVRVLRERTEFPAGALRSREAAVGEGCAFVVVDTFQQRGLDR